jgi:hypothetical protein
VTRITDGFARPRQRPSPAALLWGSALRPICPRALTSLLRWA